MRQTQWVDVKPTSLILDVPPEEVGPDYWTHCLNMEFVNDASRRTFGWTRYAGALTFTEPQFAANVVKGEISYWVICTKTAIWVTDGTTRWDITPLTMLNNAAEGKWSSCFINGLLVLNNPSNPPVYWSGETDELCAVLPGWPANTTCEVMRSLQYHLIALNITDTGGSYPNTIWWSNAAPAGQVPQEWTPTASNDAGDAVLADSDGEIHDGMQMRDSFIVYKNNTTYAMTYVGGQNIFAIRKIFSDIGTISTNAVIELNGEHWLFTGSDCIRHDGQRHQSIIQGSVQNVIKRTINPLKHHLTVVQSRPASQQVIVAYSSTQAESDKINRALVINTDNNRVGMMELPDIAFIAKGSIFNYSEDPAWSADSDSWENDFTLWNEQIFSVVPDALMLVDDTNDKLFAVEGTMTADGSSITATIARESTVIEDYDKLKIITQIEPMIHGEPGEVINISVGIQDKFGGSIYWNDPVPFTIGTTKRVDTILTGRLLSIKFTGTTARRWTVERFRVKMTETGDY